MATKRSPGRRRLRVSIPTPPNVGASSWSSGPAGAQMVPAVAAAIADGDQCIALDLDRVPLAWTVMTGSSLSAVPGRRIRLLLLYGGRSAEHEVSCISAFHIVNAGNPRYDLQLVGITRGGEWIHTTTAASALAGAKALVSPDSMALGERLPSGDTSAGTGRTASSGGSSAVEPVEIVRRGPSEAGDHDGPTVVLPLLHGPMGEDGTVQGLLEVAGVAYCGAGVAGSAAAMDKGMTKALLRSAGLPQAKYLFVREGETDSGLSDLTARVERELGWPVFVKPANMGSSIGISHVKDPGGLPPALGQARLYDEFFVIEEAVQGRELEMGVLGWPELVTSVPGEVKPSHDFYDFEDKYLDGSAGLEIPARLPSGVADEMSRLAIAGPLPSLAGRLDGPEWTSSSKRAAVAS